MHKLPGTPLIYIIGLCISIFIIGCTSKRSYDLREIESFYNGVDTKDFLNHKQKDLARLDSIYYFKYANPIDGYSIKGILRYISKVGHGTYRGNADLIFMNGKDTVYFYHPAFSIDESILKDWKHGKINTLEYSNGYIDNYSPSQLGYYSGNPFAFIDIDFDGSKELLIQLPTIGDRGMNAYQVYRYNPQERQFKEDLVYSSIGRGGCFDYFTLDDLTELNSKEKALIFSTIVGYVGNEKHYINMKDSLPIVYKVETYKCNFDSIAKRLTINGKDTVTEYFNNAY